MNPIIIGFVFLVATAGAWRFNNPFQAQAEDTFTSQQVQYFDQIIDHFTYISPQFWKQRYFVNSAYFEPSHGPILLYICGEGICNGVADQSWTSTLAQNTHGLIIALEHRYYGDSLPFRAASFEIDNMKYLNSKQALKDIAYFI
jgi:hypothetical protein